jgi:hypothetical protein
MRDLTRLALVTAVSFGVVGIAMMYANDGTLRVAATNMLTNTQHLATAVIEDFGGNSPPATTATLAPGTVLLRLPRPHQDQWLGVQGFPDTLEMPFVLPAGLDIRSGKLDLTLHSELAAGGDGRFGISINGTLRSQTVLTMGTQTLTLSIPLTAADLLAHAVTVSLTAQGTTGTGQLCAADAANNGSLVAIDETSALSLVVASAGLSPEVASFGASEPLQLALGTGDAAALAIWGRQRLARGGIDAELAAPAAGTGQFTIAAAGATLAPIGGTSADFVLAGPAGIDRVIALRGGAAALATTWPLAAATLEADESLKTFRGVQRWSLSYNLADLPGGQWPGVLALAMATSELTAGNDWLLSLALNGHLLQSGRIAGTPGGISVAVALPAQAEALTNTIGIDLVDTTPNLSVCRTGADARAQLLPTTRLLAAEPQPTLGWSAVIARLAGAQAINLRVAGAPDLATATRASALLGLILPATASASSSATPRHRCS